VQDAEAVLAVVRPMKSLHLLNWVQHIIGVGMVNKSFADVGNRISTRAGLHHSVRSLTTVLCLQIGGSDQWGNITAGTDLIRKLLGGDSGEDAPQCFGLTFPLLVS
jgi:hypothetical protein